MDLKELREKFHNYDAKFSIDFHNIDKKTGKKELSLGKTLLMFFAMIAIGIFVMLAINTLIPQTNLSLDQTNTTISESQTTCVIKGYTEPGATVKVSSRELNLNDISIDVKDTGYFEYNLKIPLNVDSAEITVISSIENKIDSKKSLTVNRDKTLVEDTTTTNLLYPTKVNNILSRYDSDNNGKIDITEFSYWAKDAGMTDDNINIYDTIFDKYDLNGDNYLDKKELDNFFANV